MFPSFGTVDCPSGYCVRRVESKVSISIISFLPMFKGLSICWCKNLMHKHHEDEGLYSLYEFQQNLPDSNLNVGSQSLETNVTLLKEAYDRAEKWLQDAGVS